MLAEVGLVGLPNAGKSSLLRTISEARPKVGAYPFTTLEPYLGMVEVGYEVFVVADIPGLIEGAHQGAGLGIDFLQHIRRTRVLLHVIDSASTDPAADVRVIRRELQAFGEGLVDKQWVIALNKIDLPEVKEQERRVVEALQKENVVVHSISALTREGVDQLMKRLLSIVQEERDRELARPQPTPTLRPEPRQEYKIVRLKRGFSVRGKAPAEIVERLGVESEEARAEVVRRLRRIGVAAALRRAGVQLGDRVRIGGAELEWPE